jgi:UV DNA damage endonuclease
MIRLGLCCIFLDAPVKFRTTTAAALARLDPSARREKLGAICADNAENLVRAVETTARLGIGAFRVLSELFPRATHPEVGYALEDLPGWPEIRAQFLAAGEAARTRGIRLSFHPDQFVVLSSPKPEVVEKSIAELACQAAQAELLGADVINIHGGGAYGDKAAALARFREQFARCPEAVRARLTVENDDVTYTVADLLPLCRDLGIPLVYDVHHHRCNPDGLDVAEATEAALATWRAAGREPHFHLSSPRDGWGAADPKPHADYLDPRDFPREWRGLDLTLDVEAKAKERAVLRFAGDLAGMGVAARLAD